MSLHGGKRKGRVVDALYGRCTEKTLGSDGTKQRRGDKHRQPFPSVFDNRARSSDGRKWKLLPHGVTLRANRASDNQKIVYSDHLGETQSTRESRAQGGCIILSKFANRIYNFSPRSPTKRDNQRLPPGVKRVGMPHLICYMTESAPMSIHTRIIRRTDSNYMSRWAVA